MASAPRPRREAGRWWPDGQDAWNGAWLGRRGARWAGYGLAVAGVVAVSVIIALIERVWPGGISLSMLYLIPVLAIASVSGRGPAVLAAVLAFLTFDFLFVEPRYTFTIRDPNEWLALLVFLLTALVTGQLAANLRLQAQEAARRERETATLYDLGQALTAAVGLGPTLEAITDRVVAVFDARSCAVLLPGDNGAFTIAATTGPTSSADLVQRDVQATLGMVLASNESRWVGPRGRARVVGLAPPPGRSALYLPLRTAGETLGVLRVGARPDGLPFNAAEERMLATFAAQAALAIARARLADEATLAEIARRSDELKSVLLSSVSHDLRTPLASIKTAVTSLLQTDVDWTDDDRGAFLTAIDEETDRLTRFVANLLDVSRIEAGSLRPEPDAVDIAETVDVVVHGLRGRLLSHPLSIEIAPDLPPGQFDAVHLEQVLANLVENAAKYAPAGTPIEVSAWASDDTIELAVVDRGPGIPPDERERVFDKFYRLRSQGQRTPGSGLGLSIVRGLVEANGGRVWLDETPDGGTTARVTVPLAGDVPSTAPRMIASGARTS